MKQIPILFISHSSKNRDKVNIIYDILKNHYITVRDYHVVFTSHSEGSLKSGENIGKHTVLNADKSAIFLAYISENYKDSPLCMAELGVAYAKNNRKNKSDFKYLLVKDRYTDFDKTTELGLGNIMMDASNVSTIESELNKVFGKTEDIKAELTNKFNEIYKGYNHKLNIAANDIKIFINKTFDCNHSLCDKPVILYVDRKVYEELSIKLTKLGDQRLLWTAFKSPLNIKRKKLGADRLTKYDRQFSEATSNKKQRLIIFNDKVEQNTYLSPSIKGLNKERKIAFNKSNEGCLYYTTQKEIIDLYNQGKKTSEKIYKPKNEELYFEYALIESQYINILVFSDFDNTNTYADGSKIQPLIFINAHTPSRHMFPPKILNSISINKYVSTNFDDLIEKNVIKQL